MKAEDPKRIWQHAVAASVKEVTFAKLNVLAAYEGVAAIRGVDDYRDTLQAAVRKYATIPDPDVPGKKGITIARLRQVFPDHDTFVAARSYLKETKVIMEVKEGQTFRLTPGPNIDENVPGVIITVVTDAPATTEGDIQVGADPQRKQAPKSVVIDVATTDINPQHGK